MAQQATGLYFWPAEPQNPPRPTPLHNFLHGRLPLLSAPRLPVPAEVAPYALVGHARTPVDRPNSPFSRPNSHPSTVLTDSPMNSPSHSPSYSPSRASDYPTTISHSSTQLSDSSSIYDRECVSWYLPPPVYTTDPEPDSDLDDGSDYGRHDPFVEAGRGAHAREEGGYVYPGGHGFGYNPQVLQLEHGHEGGYAYAHGPPQDYGGPGNQNQRPAQPYMHYAPLPSPRFDSHVRQAVYNGPNTGTPSRRQPNEANEYTPRRQPQEAARDTGASRGPMPENAHREAAEERNRAGERTPGVSSEGGYVTRDGQAGGVGPGVRGSGNESAPRADAAYMTMLRARLAAINSARNQNSPIRPVAAPLAGQSGPLPDQIQHQPQSQPHSHTRSQNQPQPQAQIQSQLRPQPQSQAQLQAMASSQTLRITLPDLPQTRIRDYLIQVALPFFRRDYQGIPTYSVRIRCSNPPAPYQSASITYAPLPSGTPPRLEEWPPSFFTKALVVPYPERFCVPEQREGAAWYQWNEILERMGGLEVRWLEKPARSEGAAGGVSAQVATSASASSSAVASQPMDVVMADG
ncbi:hypothetical protein IAT38_006442 [Cryptococcus sp. DSM 104549]